MAVSLFTFRELLKQLGVDDYGTYNVVGGVVILFSFLSNALTQANQRFLSFHLGKGDNEPLKTVFSTIINVQIIIAIVIIILAETVGLWFLNTHMNFKNENMGVVNWVYQFSICTFVVQLMQIPYTSAIISYERMSFFSYFSIGETIIKLGIVYALGLFPLGRLVWYSAFLLIAAILIWLAYFIYCNRSFKICRYRLVWSSDSIKEIFSFSSWNMIGGLGNVGASQGINILLNIFCGVAANAAMGVSHQVSAAVSSLVSNMQVAFNPQIVKSYAAGERAYFNSLIFRSGRLSLYLILMIGLPLILCAKHVLTLWLTEIPAYAVPFTQLTIVWCTIDAASGPLWIATQATGRIRNYTIILSTLLLLNLPCAYAILKLGYSPVYVIGFRVLISLLIHIFRIIYLARTINFPGYAFFKSATLKGIITAFISIPIPLILIKVLPDNVYCGLTVFATTLLIVVPVGFFMLLTKSERDFIVEKIETLKK